jgi:cob(I)alamin adenosyltransferase
MIYVFTGNGKGKTTASLGIGLRAIGIGKKVSLVQFLKTGDSSEIKTIQQIDNFKVKSFGRRGFFVPKERLAKHPELKEKGVRSFDEKDTSLVEEAINYATAQAQECNLLILDEINVVMDYKLINKQVVINFLKDFKDKIDIILTGRNCPKEILEIADLVSDCREIKHYYKRGIEPKKGIDY